MAIVVVPLFSVPPLVIASIPLPPSPIVELGTLSVPPVTLSMPFVPDVGAMINGLGVVGMVVPERLV